MEKNIQTISLHKKCIVLLTVTTFVVIVIDVIGEYYSLPWARHAFFDFAKLFLPLMFFVSHATYIFSFRRGIALMSFFCMSGLLAEVLAGRYHFIFGGAYRYISDSPLVFSRISLFDSGFWIWGVPIIIPLYWGCFLYVALSVTNSFFFFRKIQKPSRLLPGARRLAMFTFFDASIVVGIDLILDPIFVHQGNWVWQAPGQYHGIPLGNFLGWFFIAVCVAGIFRLYEYFFPQKTASAGPFFYVLAPLSVATGLIAALCIAFKKGLYPLAVLALVAFAFLMLASFHYLIRLVRSSPIFSNRFL